MRRAGLHSWAQRGFYLDEARRRFVQEAMGVCVGWRIGGSNNAQLGLNLAYGWIQFGGVTPGFLVQ
jgi:hypothetical protein